MDLTVALIRQLPDERMPCRADSSHADRIRYKGPTTLLIHTEAAFGPCRTQALVEIVLHKVFSPRNREKAADLTKGRVHKYDHRQAERGPTCKLHCP